MKRLPFGWIAGGLIAAIAILTLVAGWLAFSLADRELVNRSASAQWITATIQTEVISPSATPTLTVAPVPTIPLSLTPTPSAPLIPNLPPSHPTQASTPQSCEVCHPQPHGGGG